MRSEQRRACPWPLSLALSACIAGLAAAEAPTESEEPKEPSAKAKAWALASDALLPVSNGAALDKLEYKFAPYLKYESKTALAEWWGVASREELLDMLKWLEDEGHRAGFDKIAKALEAPKEQANAAFLADLSKSQDGAWSRSIVEKHREKVGKKSILAWDLGREITIIRQGYSAGYVTEKEAWALILPVARKLQATFDSWADLGENYLIGRDFWSEERAKGEGKQFEYLYKNLLNDPASPWKTIPWDTKLE